MKKALVLFFAFVFYANLSSQKLITIGNSTINIRGENIYSYQEIPKYGDSTEWVDIFIYNSNDSLIVSMLRSPSKKSNLYKRATIISADKKDLDIKGAAIIKYALAKEPEGLMQIYLKTKKNLPVVSYDSYYTEYRDPSYVGFMIFIVQNDEEGKKILNQIKSK